MIKLITNLVLLLFPALVLADTNSLSFTPPPSDYSVFFLTNLFGIVDGVLTAGGGLHSTGSQIMGSMFLVFNSAVLVLGGIIIMYTLIVSTMNTAHEGQMLGQKWSSIWIPIRSTLGLGLLMPKASGYCLMQIFVMWIVIQGVGAADKVWDAALSYLNRGGVIIEAQSTNPTEVFTENSLIIARGASAILTGQVCMIALEKQLTAQRNQYLKETENERGPCTTSALKDFCNNPVPDFLNSVNVVDIQNTHIKSTDMQTVDMPNLTGFYAKLNGICGKITWNPVMQFAAASDEEKEKNQQKFGFSADEYKTAQLSRSIAIQQMYVTLSAIANLIVSNNPQIGTIPPKTLPPKTEPEKGKIEFAKQQFGVPKTAQGGVCESFGNTCTSWGPATDYPDLGVLFNGSEFQAAVNDYNGVMKPTLNTIKQSDTQDTAKDSRKFINEASARGWIMAGAYFFDLVRLNSASKTNAASVDTQTGLGKSEVDVNRITKVDDYPMLAAWLSNPDAQLSQIATLIGGPPPTLDDIRNLKVIKGAPSSTVRGFINNSAMVQLPGQPGLAPLQFAKMITFSTDVDWGTIPHGNPYRACSFYFNICTLWWSSCGVCVDRVMFNGLYNLGVDIANYVLQAVQLAIENVINAILWVPIQGIGVIFKEGVATISAPGVNPVVALANMGVAYLNFAGTFWFTALTVLLPASFFPPLYALLIMAFPLIMAWMGILVGISFITAYYIPILPYMMFLFGAIGWLTSVIEAMVAAPLVALGITHPEGNEAFGKGEHSIMILLNVFLRPAMMIIGYVAAIALTYVSVWLLNAGFDHAISFMQYSGPEQLGGTGPKQSGFQTGPGSTGSGVPGGLIKYTSWAGLFAFFFSIIIYTTIYLIITQKAFSLISYLPDQVLRWIGGAPERIGTEAAQWGEEAKGGIKEAGAASEKAQAAIGAKAEAGVQKGVVAAKQAAGAPQMDVQAELGSKSTAKPPDTPQGGGSGGMTPPDIEP